MAHRIDHATRLLNANGPGRHGFTNGDPNTMTPPTELEEDWHNGIQEAVVRPIELVGHELVKGDHDQLFRAMMALSEMQSLSNPVPVTLAGATLAKGAASLLRGAIVVVGSGTNQIWRAYRSASFSPLAQDSSTDTLNDVLSMHDDVLDNFDAFLAVGESGNIQTIDANAFTATRRTPAGGFSGDFHSVTYFEAAGLFVAVGTGGTIQTSPDGATWTSRSAGIGYVGTFQRVRAIGDHVFAVGTDGAIQFSTDGITWFSASIAGGSTASLNRVFYHRGFLRAVEVGGSGYRTLPSTPGGDWIVDSMSGSDCSTYSDMVVRPTSSGEAIEYSCDSSIGVQGGAGVFLAAGGVVRLSGVSVGDAIRLPCGWVIMGTGGEFYLTNGTELSLPDA